MVLYISIFICHSLQVICHLLSFIGNLIVKKNDVCYNVIIEVGVCNMAKKKKNVKKAKIRILLFFVVFGSITVYLSYNFFSNVSKIMDIKKEKQALEDKLVNLQSKEEELNSDIKKLEDPEYVARYAREKYMYSKDGELIIRIPDEN